MYLRTWVALSSFLVVLGCIPRSTFQDLWVEDDDELPEAPGVEEPVLERGVSVEPHGGNTRLPANTTQRVFVRANGPLPAVEINFTDFTSGNPADTSMISRLIDLINETTLGDEIRYVVWQVNMTALPQALLNAQQRGVKVRVIRREEDKASQGSALLESLGIGHKYCGASHSGGGCISRSPHSDTHTKFMTFSGVGTTYGKLVWVGSTNIAGGGGYKNWNDAVLVHSDAYHDALAAFFDDWLWAEAPAQGDDYYTAVRSVGRGAYLDPNEGLEHWMSPDLDADTRPHWLDVLEKFQPSGAGCDVKTAFTGFRADLSEVAQRMVLMAEQGCTFELLVNRMDPEIWNILLGSSSATARGNITVRRVQTGKPGIHSKLMLIRSAQTPGGAVSENVFTGSNNMLTAGNLYNDEIIFKIANPKVYAAYLDYHRRIVSAGTQLCTSAELCRP